MPEWAQQLITPAIILGVLAFGWKVLGRMEDRIITNADKAHTTIGENIQRLDTKMDRLESDVSTIKVDAATLKTDMEWVKHSLQQP